MEILYVNTNIFYLLCALEDLAPTKLRVTLNGVDYRVLIERDDDTNIKE
jgi:hypothetical protein